MYQQKEQQIIGGGYLNGARRFESSISKFEKSSPHPHKRRFANNYPKMDAQLASFKGYSSSEESILRNKSKSTSSIDTNAIIEDYEQRQQALLQQQRASYRKSSDFSEIVGIETSNYDEIMQIQKRQSAAEKSSLVRHLKAHYQPLIDESSASPCSHNHNHHHHHSVTKISRQTQVQQRSRKPETSSLRCHNHAHNNVKIPEVLLKKGEVQKRVDEWLSQTRNQNFKEPTTKGLQRSNSNAEQKSHRRSSRHHEASRARKSQLNASSSYDDLSHDNLRGDRKVSVGVNTSRGTYRQYLALRSRAKMLKMQQECLENVARLQRSREVSPSSRPIHFRTEVTNLSFRSRNSEPTPDIRSRSNRQMENRISGLVRARNEATSTTDFPRRSFKRESKSGLPYDTPPPNLVSSRVQAFQNRLQGSNVVIETNQIKSPIHARKNPPTPVGGQSTFKPFETGSAPSSPPSVSLEQVVHADDLESLLKPSPKNKNFFYGDRLSKELADDVQEAPKIKTPPPPPPQRSPSIRATSKSTNALYRETDFGTYDQQIETKEILINQHTKQVSLSEILNKPDAVPTYESRSTLKLNQIRNMTDYLLDTNNQRETRSDNQNNNNNNNTGKGQVVNEVLVKNLQFKQDTLPAPPLPPPRTPVSGTPSPKISPVIKQQQQPSIQKQVVVELTPLFQPPSKQPLNYNSVLSDDYTSLHSRIQMREKNKIYVTKEEMERQRLMDLLRKGEFDIVKAELDRSYTVSTPNSTSPSGGPPCSPPPAPTAYITSARASSRKLATLGAGGTLPSLGSTSPERDPLGKLLRYLKTFYRELATRDSPNLPSWASPLPPGTLCPAHFQPHLQIIHKSDQEHRLENIGPDQIFAPFRLSDGSVSEAPRRVSVEGGPCSGRTSLCLRLLYQWACQHDAPDLALIVPLRELRGGSLLNYLSRELFPRGSPFSDSVQQIWRALQLMEDRVFFVLDGYDECIGGRNALGEAADLLEGKLFPEARILLTCSPMDAAAVSPLVQRRLHLAGLEWAHVERLSVAYFIHNDLAERACEFLEILNSQPTVVKQVAQHPLGWLMLCALYQDMNGMPEEPSCLVAAAVKCVVKRSLDPPIPHNNEIPAHCRKRLEDFGRLALSALRVGRTCYQEPEFRGRGGLEVTKLGFLAKVPHFSHRRKSPDLYAPLHSTVAEFLAAYYLASVAQYTNILRRELEGLPSGVLSHLAALLGPRTHLVLRQLCPLEAPARSVFDLLRAAGTSDGNVAAICRLVGAGPAFGPAPCEKPTAPLVHTSPNELDGWARILSSNACSLESLEVLFQVERSADPKHLDNFFGALAANESVKLVRVTSLLGQEFPQEDALWLAEHVRSVLAKKRLHEFELVITCLEESSHDRLECVVSALCLGLGQASPQLSRLVLDMNLSGEQVSRVCEALRDCLQIQALHLPHLGCGCEGLAAVAELLKDRPLLALNLAGSWGAKNEDPSSSGISMGSGSGSGSSNCASSTLGSLPTSRCYSSLPRGAMANYGGFSRPATLPRLPLGYPGTPVPNGDKERDSSGNSSKRNSDSVLCHRSGNLQPLPNCDSTSHQGSGFHEIFAAIRETDCKLRSLNVSKCLLGSLDANCLGETIRRAQNLDAVRAAGASRPGDVMPIVLALTETPCLQLLDLSSPRLALDDHPSQLLCHALARNSTVKLLNLEGWTFRIEESESLSIFSELLSCTNVRELSLCNVRLHLAIHEGPLSRLGRRDDAGAELLRAAAPTSCSSIVFLRLAGFQVTVNDRPALRGPLLLPFLVGFTNLSELDLSLDKSTLAGATSVNGSSSGLLIDDKLALQFFSVLGRDFRRLQTLRINYWRISLDDADRTTRQIGRHLRSCTNLSCLSASGLRVHDSGRKIRAEHGFLQAVIGNLRALTWICLDGLELTENPAKLVGKCLRERFNGSALEISAKDVKLPIIKALVTSVEEGGKAEVTYAGGPGCRLRITKLQKPRKKG